MSLNDIHLSQNELVLLYKKVLVENGSLTDNPSFNKDSADWKYLGENKKNVLVIVNYENVVHIPDKQLAFLTKLLSACNLNLGDVAVLNFFKYSLRDHQSIISFFRPKAVLMFNLEPTALGLPMQFPAYQVQRFKDSFYIHSPSLENIEHDKSSKGKLWTGLKKIFNL